MQNVITIAPLDVSKAAEAEQKGLQALAQASRCVINDAQTADGAVRFLDEIKTKLLTLEDVRKTITKPLDESKKAVMDLFRKPIEAYSTARDIVRKALVEYHSEQERIQAEAKRQAEVDAAAKQAEILKRAEKAKASGRTQQAEFLEQRAEAVVTSVPEVVPQKIAGLTFREKWTALVVTPSLVPREYLIPDQAALDELARKTKGSARVAGVNFKMEKIPVQGR